MLKPNPEIMRFAVDRSGREYSFFQRKWKYFDNWLDGTAAPTLKQIQEFAHMTHIPVADLFGDEVPSYDLPIPDYRTIGNAHVAPSPELYDTIMMMLWRQDWMREYFEGNECDPVSFVDSITEKPVADSGRIATVIRDFFDLKPDWATVLDSPADAFRFLRHQVEQARISVAVSGHVGNDTHRTLKVSEFRGFVLADSMAPLIFINGADADSAKCFTLFHELAHLALAETGVVSADERTVPAAGMERLCNAAAAELMVPEELLKSLWPASTDDLYGSVKGLARKLKASVPTVTIRARELGLMSFTKADRVTTQYTEDMGNVASRRSKGGDYYAAKGVELGKVFSESIDVGVRTGMLSYTEAFQLTGLNRKTFHTLFQANR